ncbi:phosphatidylcholine transfer protein isoform X4 [Artibeus jamaicensis]|uniref:phosphatidylcholine transfer protein isoform X4 n=1 Tax=Artibeus jamaicensis TaxID=9417 RepID=UPI00235AD37F|nr:phosphatidylcholine transfer protein isoform X4 [Artibeus jamaicensis]
MDPATVGGFSQEQFREACAELHQPALAGADWQLLVETSGISIYRLLDQQTGLYEYKVFGVLADCPPDVFADVYMDLDYRKQWDQYVKAAHSPPWPSVISGSPSNLCQEDTTHGASSLLISRLLAVRQLTERTTPKPTFQGGASASEFSQRKEGQGSVCRPPPCLLRHPHATHSPA